MVVARNKKKLNPKCASLLPIQIYRLIISNLVENITINLKENSSRVSISTFDPLWKIFEIFFIWSPSATLCGILLTDCTDDTGDVEPGGEIVEPTLVSEDRPQLPSQASLHQQVHVLPVFERAIQAGKEEEKHHII